MKPKYKVQRDLEAAVGGYYKGVWWGLHEYMSCFTVCLLWLCQHPACQRPSISCNRTWFWKLENGSFVAVAVGRCHRLTCLNLWWLWMMIMLLKIVNCLSVKWNNFCLCWRIFSNFRCKNVSWQHVTYFRRLSLICLWRSTGTDRSVQTLRHWRRHQRSHCQRMVSGCEKV